MAKDIRDMRSLRRSGVLAWLRLARVFEKTERAGEAQLRAWGLNMGQFDALAHIGAAEGLSQGELARSLLVTKGNVTQLLAKMEMRGLIERRSEGRTKRLFLTGEGRTLYDEVVPAHEEFIAGRLDALDEDERKTLHELLRKLDRDIE
ncbi:MAG: MarR family transcriptional regulator [Actinomycetota bacterium]|nr:MarR family transcriptional regulator [Actinomycetota bacterium]